ncbi:hypothetical protein K474DRAFT_1655746 [Panus rudis PR-1116 ss-1]|nr:hypothetical protein K474DRAFT_1655746 [Panus rudis PR-1116 ss-1]
MAGEALTVRNGSPPLPPELIHEIIENLTYHDLPKVALVSKTIRVMAYSHLYRQLPSLSPRPTVLLMRTLASSVELAKLVRTLNISDLKSYTLVAWTTAFYKLMSDALHNMLNLIDLRLYILGSYTSYLPGCPFQLQSLRIAGDWDKHLGRWLGEQHQITDLWVFSLKLDPVHIADAAVPHLARVMGPPSVVASLVPGRPVKVVDLSIAQQEHFIPDIMRPTCRILDHSMGPLSELIITVDITDMLLTDVFETIDVVPEILPNLSLFTVFAARSFINGDFLNRFGETLSKFKSLRRTAIYSTNPHDALGDWLITRELASRWHKLCPTLRYVDIGGIVWIYDNMHGWQTTDALKVTMLQRLHEARAREKALLEELQALQARHYSV